MGYIEQSPGDVRRMIEEYARREVLIEITGGIEIIISLPCSLNLPYEVDEHEL